MIKTAKTNTKTLQFDAQTGELDVNPLIRNSAGLLPHLKYPINSRGYVNWKELIDHRFIVPKRDIAIEAGQDRDDITTLRDDQKLVKLFGYRDLANIRGYTHCEVIKNYADRDFVSLTCQIDWIGNYETGGVPIRSFGVGDAHDGNTDGFCKVYLSAIAENRAFIRCVRNFLGIEILGQDELGAKEIPKQNVEPSVKPIDVFYTELDRLKVSFDILRDQILKSKVKMDFAFLENVKSPEEINTTNLMRLTGFCKTIKKK